MGLFSIKYVFKINVTSLYFDEYISELREDSLRSLVEFVCVVQDVTISQRTSGSVHR